MIRLNVNADIASCSCFHVKSGVDSEGLQFYITLLKMRDIITIGLGETNCQRYNALQWMVELSALAGETGQTSFENLIIGFDLTANWPNSEILLLYIARDTSIKSEHRCESLIVEPIMIGPMKMLSTCPLESGKVSVRTRVHLFRGSLWFNRLIS